MNLDDARKQAAKAAKKMDTCKCGHPRDGHKDNTGRCECGWFDLMTVGPDSIRFCKCRSFRAKG